MSIATEEQTVVDSVQKQLYIGGEWRDASGSGTLDVIDPSTEEAICAIADGTPTTRWPRSTPPSRLRRSGRPAPQRPRRDPLEGVRADDRARGRAGHPDDARDGQAGGRVEGRDHLRGRLLPLVLGRALRIDGTYKQFANGTSRVLVMKQPVGPSLMITPGTSRWRWARARPAPPSRRAARRDQAGAADAAVDAGDGQDPRGGRLPGGVLNILTTSSSGSTTGPLIEDERLRKLSFTGSTEVGRKLIEASAKNVLKTSMELGGNAPFLVFDDADLDAAVDGALLAKMRNIGEACVGQPLPRGRAGARGVRAPAGREDGRPQDRPRDRGGREGRPADRPAVAREGGGAGPGRARQGATCVVGGEIPDGRGYFYPRPCWATSPTTPACCHEEIFGPVAPVGFESEEDAIARGQRHRVRPGRLRVHARHQASDPRLRGPRHGHGGPQPGHGLQRRRPSAASSSRASGARAATRAWRSSSRPSTWP